MISSVVALLRDWRRSLWRGYVFSFRRHIPAGMRREIGRIYARYIFWRISPVVTARLGPRYRRGRDRIDIDITWDCNLRCFSRLNNTADVPGGSLMSPTWRRAYKAWHAQPPVLPPFPEC